HRTWRAYHQEGAAASSSCFESSRPSLLLSHLSLSCLHRDTGTPAACGTRPPQLDPCPPPLPSLPPPVLASNQSCWQP
uniref:Uncharacterized protein n=1 Tax=Triticum urartu TaxID=4572 RepID=A0A8R7USF5_TRIUA